MEGINYKDEKAFFESLSEKLQWRWIVVNRESVTLTLDNDNTTFTFNDEDKTDDCTLVNVKADIGNRHGLEHLLKAIGIAYEWA